MGPAVQSSWSDDKARVLDATDIASVIAEYIALKPKGREFVCLCPFHNDRNPSMYVVPHKGMFHCFVCGAGGNAIDFLMKHAGLSFGEALRALADKAGVELQWKPQARHAPGTSGGAPGGEEWSREDIAEANRFAQSFFESIFRHAAHGAPARAMVERRGISPEMVERFRIGAAPDRWDGLVQTIERKGMDVGPFVAAGLLKKRAESTGVYDAFRNRLMFPILDQSGRIVAFGGRVLETRENEAKYLNSPETPVFSKGSQLYGLRQGIGAIQETRRAIVTEGYTDVIACHQAGFASVVATLGTALTHRHAALLRRICDRVVLLFDGDEAGQRAADRAFEVLFGEPIDVRVAVVPGGQDPDEMLKTEGGAARFGALLDGAVDLHEYRFARLEESVRARGLGAGGAARARVAEEYAARLGELGLLELPPIRMQSLVRRIARLGGVGEQAVVQTARRAASKPTGVRAVRDAITGGNAAGTFRPTTAPEWVLACVLTDGELVQKISMPTRDFWEERVYAHALAGPIARAIADLGPAAATDTLARVMRALDDAEARAAAAAMAAEVHRITEGDADRLRAHFDECVRRMELERVRKAHDPASQGTTESNSDEEFRDPMLDARVRRIEMLRDTHRRHGGNPAAVPRPTV